MTTQHEDLFTTPATPEPRDGSRPLFVLDLFSGLRGWSSAFEQRGHEVYCVEIQERFTADWRDIFTFDPATLPRKPDIVLASPPCTAFTVMQIGRNWTHDNQPKTERAREGLRLLERTIEVIRQIDPRFFIIENPRGKMRKMPHLQHLERRTVTYCQFGEKRMKPTDLFGNFPPTLHLPPPCKNGDPCHISSPRGSTNGTQGMDSAEAAMIPFGLSLAVCYATEAAIYTAPRHDKENTQ